MKVVLAFVAGLLIGALAGFLLVEARSLDGVFAVDSRVTVVNTTGSPIINVELSLDGDERHLIDSILPGMRSTVLVRPDDTREVILRFVCDGRRREFDCGLIDKGGSFER